MSPLAIELKLKKASHRLKQEGLHFRMGSWATRSRPSPKHFRLWWGAWLIDPLKAPQFALPDLNGNLHDLRSFQGMFVLLTFWANSAVSSLEQLKMLHRHTTEFPSSSIQVLAVNLDDAEDQKAAITFVKQQRFDFFVLLATKEMAGIYNIIFRHMFDRRRDLGIPTSFLIDRAGMIVKVYEGVTAPKSVRDDIDSAPTNYEDRLKRAIPFPGSLILSSFQRNDFTYGVSMFQHGYLDQAAESFRQVLVSKPDDPDAYYNLGTLALRKNDFTLARVNIERSLKLRSNYPEAWNNLGMIAAQQGHPMKQSITSSNP